MHMHSSHIHTSTVHLYTSSVMDVTICSTLLSLRKSFTKFNHVQHVLLVTKVTSKLKTRRCKTVGDSINPTSHPSSIQIWQFGIYQPGVKCTIALNVRGQIYVIFTIKYRSLSVIFATGLLQPALYCIYKPFCTLCLRGVSC